jgi:2-iminobutanoate/2-iminopropanoate deaminase
MPNRAIQTDNAPRPGGHYSQAVRAGNLLFVSGQLPFDKEGRVSATTMADQTRQTLSHVRSIVEAAGGTLASIAQCTVYITDISLWADVNKAYGEFFSEVPVLPARAIVPVKDLHHGAHIEIQATAILE